MASTAPGTNGAADFDTIPDAIEALRNDTPILVLDSPDRENEADLILPALSCTPARTAFLIRHTSGFLCVSLPPSLCRKLELPQMVVKEENKDPNGTAYCVTVDAGEQWDVSTGISAQDRSRTIMLLGEAGREGGGGVGPRDFRRPGHVVPLQAREGGVRVRQGHTEAAADFCRLAGKGEVGVLAELVEDGAAIVVGEGEGRRGEMGPGFGMMRRDAALAFGRRHGLKVVTIEGLVEYLEQQDRGKAKG